MYYFIWLSLFSLFLKGIPIDTAIIDLIKSMNKKGSTQVKSADNILLPVTSIYCAVPNV